MYYSINFSCIKFVFPWVAACRYSNDINDWISNFTSNSTNEVHYYGYHFVLLLHDIKTREPSGQQPRKQTATRMVGLNSNYTSSCWGRACGQPCKQIYVISYSVSYIVFLLLLVLASMTPRMCNILPATYWLD